MKTILVLTDFTNKSLIAAEAAVLLAGKIHADLLVMHSDNNISIIPYYEGGVMITENVSWENMQKEQLNKLIVHLKAFASLHLEQHLKINIRGKLMPGELLTNVQEIVKHHDIEFIVTGTRSGSKIDHILFGSDISTIIEHVDRPVLIIPKNYNFLRLDRVIFATNFNETDIDAINDLLALGELLEYQLEIVHVSLYGSKQRMKNEKVRSYINEISEEKYPTVMFKNIKGKRLLPRLIKQFQEREADLLVFSHQHHSFFTQILKEGTTINALRQQKIPIMVVPIAQIEHKKNKN